MPHVIDTRVDLVLENLASVVSADGRNGEYDSEQDNSDKSNHWLTPQIEQSAEQLMLLFTFANGKSLLTGLVMNLELTSERLRLTPLSDSDVDIAIEMFTEPAVTKYVCDLMNEDEVRREMPTWTRRGGNGYIGIWCISDRTTAEKYGSALLLPMPINEDDTDWDLVIPGAMPEGDVEIGFTLKQTAWGKGIATESCRRLLRFAFEETDLQEVVAVIDEDNRNSGNALKKSGLSDEGFAMAYGEDCPFFRITREQWTAQSHADRD